MIQQKNISLKPYNTFGIDVKANSFFEINSVEELKTILKQFPESIVLGGGSNILLTKDIDVPVLVVKTKGKKILEISDEKYVYVQVEGGENWHEFVLWCLENNFGGLENLSLIPGNVGTSPIQNIGAYGVEIKDVFHSLDALEISTGLLKSFTAKDCNFGYRDSYFKQKGKKKFVIVNVTFKLTRKDHVLNTTYGAISEELSNMGIKAPSIQDISKAVISIRESKLPDPKIIGNSGSFFKNPVIPLTQFENLSKLYPNIPGHKNSTQEVKVPAGWLIEQSGFKGQRFGDAGVHAKQALVLVNYGKARGLEILDLAKNIQNKVQENFGILLEMEVNIL